MINENVIRAKITRAFLPQYLEVNNFSDDHAGPKGRSTHFEVIVVSDAFIGLNAVERHRRVYAVLNSELNDGVHALSIKNYTLKEWEEKKLVSPPPPCSFN